jgi:glycosyltransferase involved in cell wall biosynthesis
MKILWVGDAVVQTGFARVTHAVCDRLSKKHDVEVLGVNYNGDPTRGMCSYPVWPAMPGGDILGVGRITGICNEIKPDVVMILNDPWVVKHYLAHIPKQIPVVAYMPVDAPNQDASDLTLARAITYTGFGRREMILGGFRGRVDVIPHGVDTSIYHPATKAEARSYLKTKSGLNPNDLFVVGNVNRNQPRKRLDLTIQYWTQWWINAGQPREAFLYLHAANKDQGYNLLQLANYFGISKQFIITDPRMSVKNCVSEKEMRFIYSIFDVQINTGLGEGWGLTTHEGMACGVPQIVPRYSALGEWCDGAVDFVETTSIAVTPEQINTIGGVPDMGQFVAAIQKVYEDKEHRLASGEAALRRATEPRFSWDIIAQQFSDVLEDVVGEQSRVPVGISR